MKTPKHIDVSTDSAKMKKQMEELVRNLNADINKLEREVASLQSRVTALEA